MGMETLDCVVHPPSGEVGEYVYKASTDSPPLNQAISAFGLLLDVVHVRVTLSPGFASVGPLIFTSLGLTTGKKEKTKQYKV